MMAHLGLSGVNPGQVYAMLEARLQELVSGWLENADPGLPVVLTAHGSAQGASYGGERTVMLGGDLVLSGGLVKDPRLDYVALGHIHKAQNLNENAHPPVIYPGSIERVDFGEAREDKFFVIAAVERGRTQVEWRQLTGVRPFIDSFLRLEASQPPEGLTERLRQALPDVARLAGAVVRLTIEYPREWDPLIDEPALRLHAAQAFEFRLVRRPQIDARIRLPEDQSLSSLNALDLLDIYWRASHVAEEELQELARLAAQVITQPEAEV
jgi:exonuclease SbcD